MSQLDHDDDQESLNNSISDISMVGDFEDSASPLAVDNYFGENARTNFFHHYKFIADRSNITLDELDDPSPQTSPDKRSLPKVKNNNFTQSRPHASHNNHKNHPSNIPHDPNALPNSIKHHLQLQLSPVKENIMKPPRKDSLPSHIISPLPSARGQGLDRRNSHSKNSSRNPTPELSSSSVNLSVTKSLPEIRSPVKPPARGPTVSRTSSRTTSEHAHLSPRHGLYASDSELDDNHSVNSDITFQSFNSQSSGGRGGKGNKTGQLAPLASPNTSHHSPVKKLSNNHWQSEDDNSDGEFHNNRRLSHHSQKNHQNNNTKPNHSHQRRPTHESYHGHDVVHSIVREARAESEDHADEEDDDVHYVHDDDYNDDDLEEDLQSISYLTNPTNQKRSPRTKYIRNCIKENINPRPSLLVRKNMTKRLDLHHHGMSDDFAKTFATSLQELPYLETINIADNRLSDVGLTAIIHEITNITSLTELNLSQNKIGKKAANALHAYLSSATCPLHRLILHNADLDDDESNRLLRSIEGNSSSRLIDIDLSHNQIGKKENLKKALHLTTSSINNLNASNLPSSSSSSSSGGRMIEAKLNIVDGFGADALALLLVSPTCQLIRLNLTWNMIRLDGARKFAQSLALNSSLIYLDLSYNSLGTAGSVAIGSALIQNNLLEEMNLSFNSIDAVGCISLIAGVIENRSLKKLILDGNPIGDQGIKTILLLPILSIRGIDISVAKCNVAIKDSHCFFDFDRIDTDYILNMENGFHRSVAIILSHFIAGHQKFNFSKCEYADSVPNAANNSISKPSKDKANSDTDPNSSGSVPKVPIISACNNSNLATMKDLAPVFSNMKFAPLDLQPTVSQDCVNFFSEKEKELLLNLEKLKHSASNLHAAAELFMEIDQDNSGTLDKKEISFLMKKMGIDLSDKRLQDLMKRFEAVYAADCLDFLGFLGMIKHLKVEADVRIKEMTQRPILTTPIASSSEEREPFIPPETGILSLTVINDLTRTGISRVLTTCDCEHILTIVKSIGGSNFLDIVLSCLDHSLLRMNEALTLIDLLLMESRDKVDLVRRVLMQLYDSNDAIYFIHSVFQHNRSEVLRLKWEYGMVLRPLLGNPNGYYVLDLSKEIDRKCLLKLVKLHHQQKHHDIQGALKIWGGEASGFDEAYHIHMKDVSQLGNYSAFRNELLDNEPVIMNDAFASALPNSGIFQFDFILTPRPPKPNDIVHAKTDDQMIQILLKHHLLPTNEVEIAEQKLEFYRYLSDESLSCNGTLTTNDMSTKTRAEAIGQHMSDFYSQLSNRAQLYQEAREKICKPAPAPTLSVTAVPVTNKSSQGRRLHTAASEKPNGAGLTKDMFLRDTYPMPTSLVNPYQSGTSRPVTTRLNTSSCSSRPTTAHNSARPVSKYLPSASSSRVTSARQTFQEKEKEKEKEREREFNFSLDTNDSYDEFNISRSRDDYDILEEFAMTSRRNTTANALMNNEGAKTVDFDLANDLENFSVENKEKPKEKKKSVIVSPLDLDSKVLQHQQYLLKRQQSLQSMTIEHSASIQALKIDVNQQAEDEEFHSPKQDKLKEEEMTLEQQLIDKARKMRAQHAEGDKSSYLHQSRRRSLYDSTKDDFLTKFKSLLDSMTVQEATKGHRLVDVLDDLFSKTWIYARHLALMLECFVQYGYYRQTPYFGTYRVELVIHLYPRVIDLHNFELVMSVLSPYEAACVTCRIGFLRVFNPCKPEGAWELDLSRHEERLIVKMLCMLGIYEPGNNFLHASFRWSRDVEALPGWELGHGWLTDEGLPTKGILSVTYYSGEGKGLHGCKAFVSFRKALLNLVLIHEEEIVEEEFAPIAIRNLGRYDLPGEKCFQKYRELWENYFLPLPEDPKKKKKKKAPNTKK